METKQVIYQHPTPTGIFYLRKIILRTEKNVICDPYAL
jgi:hypothetical protein